MEIDIQSYERLTLSVEGVIFRCSFYVVNVERSAKQSITWAKLYVATPLNKYHKSSIPA